VRWLDSLVNPGPDADRRVALDLVANSMRAAGLHRYDDAVARLYRACEMHAQNRLRELGALAMPKTTVRWDAAPPSLQQEWLPRRSKEGTLMLGLRDLYRLLHALGDELGQRFEDSPLSSDKSPLEARNNSILAHGNSPLTLDSYEGFRKALEALMAISQADLPKPFPRIGPANLLA
jgi:CRISPR-associated protein (TIGR02710 family)